MDIERYHAIKKMREEKMKALDSALSATVKARNKLSYSIHLESAIENIKLARLEQAIESLKWEEMETEAKHE